MISRFLKASKTLRNKFGGQPGQRARARKRKQRLLFEALEDRRLLAASPPLLTSIEGFNQDDNAFNTGDAVLQPPDPNGAVGLEHILNVGNTSIQWFTKDGTPHYHTSLKNFFAPLRPDYGIFDPKALYDQYANRFLVVALEAYEVANGDLFDMSRIMVAVSDDGDPNGKWYYHSINGQVNVPDPTTPGINLITWTDYPGFALDEEAIYVTGNLFEIGTGDSYGNRLWIMDKGLGKGGFYENGPALVNMHDPAKLTGVDFTGNYTQGRDFRSMTPAHVFGNAPTGVGTWLTLYDGYSNGVEELVDVIRVNNPLGTPTFTRFTVNVGDIEDSTLLIRGSTPQRGVPATIDFGDRRTLNAVWRDNALYVTTVIYPTSGPDTNQVTAHWFKFDTTNAQALKLADQGSVAGEELGFAVHTGWPAVNVDSQGNMAIGFAATGPNLHPGAYYAVRAPGDLPGTLRTPVAIAEGLDSYGTIGALRWGDYTSVALDPADGVTFWAYSEYALPRQLQLVFGRWGTRWGSFRLAEPTPPPVPGPVTITGLVWHDQDESRLRDAKEPGLSGWTIYADLDGDGERDLGEPSVKTDSVGKYSFTLTDVTGSLTIREAVKPGWQQTFPGEPALAQVLTITGGGTIKDVNFGNSDNDGFDHGDAPSPYPTLEAINGPTHAISPGFGLGVEAADGSTVVVDGEPDGLPDANALGDDNDNFDDENGVVFGTGFSPGQVATLTVTVSTGANAPGMLQGWIDFNRDGDWADAGEQVFKNRTLAAGVHALTVSVPSTAIPGTTFARFRYGYEKDLSYVGPSYAGEIEDYRVDVLSERPNAVDDPFTVEQDSRDNPFDVLANDVPGANGITKLRIRALNMTGASGTATIERNGTPDDYTDDFVRYTPRAGAFGPDAFSYTVEDTVNGTSDTATVSVTITQAQGDSPIAVDDSYFVPPPTVDPKLLDVPGNPNLFYVLGNDRAGPTGVISIPSNGLDDSATVGTVNLELATIDGKSVQVVRYTPVTGFNGTDQFRYTIVDANGVTSTGTVTVQVGNTRTSDDLVRIRLETRDLNGNLITQIGQGMQFQVWAYVRDMRNVAGYASVPGFPASDQGVFSAYMDLLYDTEFVSYAGVEFSTDYSEENFPDAGVPGILDEIGAFQGAGSDNNFGEPYGPSEKLLYKATFTASELGTARFKSDPADDIPLHETSLNIPPGTLDNSQIDFRATTIDVINSPDLVQIRVAATTIAGAPLSQVTAGTEFYVKAYVDDLGVRNGIPSFPQSQEGVFSAYLDILYNSALAQPVTVSTSQNPLGFDITAGPLFQEGLKGINRSTAGIVDEVGAFQGGTATRFPDERLLFQIRFRALSGPGGTLTFAADSADEPVNETTLIKPDPGVSVPTAQVRYVSATPITVVGGAGEGEFTNPNNRYDVTNDGIVTPGDVLAVVNLLNSSGTTVLTPAAGGEGEAGRMYYDVNSDYLVSPIDVLSVINFINGATSQATGEGEASTELLASASTVEAGLGGGLPAENLASPRVGAGASVRESQGVWAWSEDREAVDYFASEPTAGEVGSGSAQETDLSDDLVDDIAAAWGSSSEVDLLLSGLA